MTEPEVVDAWATAASVLPLQVTAARSIPAASAEARSSAQLGGPLRTGARPPLATLFRTGL